MATPAYVNVGTAAAQLGGTSLSPALPGSRTNGNVLIAVVSSLNNDTHGVSGSGWAAISGLPQTNSGSGLTTSYWWRIVDGTEGIPTFSWTNSSGSVAQIIQYTNTDPGGPFGAIGTPGTGTSATHTSTSVTTTKANSLVIYFDSAEANTALGTPSGWTQRFAVGQVAVGFRFTGGDKTVAVSGTSSGSISVTGANAAWVQVQIELKEPVLTHASSGALTGAGSAISGAAARVAPHPTSGVLIGAGSAIAGAAAHNKPHAGSGILTGPGALLSGAAAIKRLHDASGALAGSGAVLDGMAIRFRALAATGDLIGPSSTIVGAAYRQTVIYHAASGSLIGAGAEIAGAAAIRKSHGASGILVGSGATVSLAFTIDHPPRSPDAGSMIVPAQHPGAMGVPQISPGGMAIPEQRLRPIEPNP